MEKQIEKKACKNCIHYQMCLDSYREGVRQGENLDMSEEEYFADTCGCNFYADNRIYRKQSEVIDEFAEKLKQASIRCGIPLLGLSTKDEIEEYFNGIMLHVRDAIDSIAKEMKGGAE